MNDVSKSRLSGLQAAERTLPLVLDSRLSIRHIPRRRFRISSTSVACLEECFLRLAIILSWRKAPRGARSDGLLLESLQVFKACFDIVSILNGDDGDANYYENAGRLPDPPLAAQDVTHFVTPCFDGMLLAIRFRVISYGVRHTAP